MSDRRSDEPIGRRRTDRAGAEHRLWELVDAGIALSGELDLAAVLQRIVEAACHVIGARYGALGVVNDDRSGLSEFVYHGVSAAQARRIGHLPVGKGLLGALIDDPRPIRLDDLSSDGRSVGFPSHHPPMHTFLGVPVRTRGTVYGNLYLAEKDGGAGFTAEDEQLAVALAGQAAVAISNAQLFEAAALREREALRRLEELTTVQEVAAAVLTELDPQRVLRMIAMRARELVKAHSGVLAMVEPDGRHFLVRVAAGRAARTVEGTRLPVEGSLSGRTLQTGEPVLVDDVLADENAYYPIAVALGARSAIFVPLDPDEAAGVLAVAHGEPGRLTPDDMFVLRSFAQLASLALRNARQLTAERQRAHVEAELDATRMREELRAELLRRVIRAQEDERGRIARELHDSVGQSLASILLGLKVVSEEKTLVEVRARLSDLREIAAQSTAELRRIALELRPSVLDDLGLEAALDRLQRDVGARTDLEVETDVEIGGRRLAPEVETVVYRVAQEALTNAAKHAGAASVRVLLGIDDGDLRLVVDDDGPGFEMGDVADRGLGLRGMEERADLVGAKLEIRTAPGSGTRVLLVVPIEGSP